MQKMKNFKGLYHNKHIEIPSYEGGAHFKYEDLYIILEYIARSREKPQKKESKRNIRINIPKNSNTSRVS